MIIPVIAYFPSGDISKGSLMFTAQGPKLVIENRSSDVSIGESVLLSIIEGKYAKDIPLEPGDKFEYASMSVTKKYSPNSLTIQENYPPSSKGWITHLSESGAEALFSVQKIIGKEQYLLSIVDINSNKVQGLCVVHTYEIGILFMEADWDRYNRIMDETSIEIDEVSIDKLLNGPAPSWSKLSQLLEGINVPNLVRGKTMRDSMSQLIPVSFPENVKLELMAFLAYVINSKIPTEDPLDFQITMRKQFQSAPLLRILVYGHVQCLLEGIQPPQYVRIMIMADRGLLKTGLEPAPTERDPWATTWYNLMEMLPSRRGRVAEIARNLNQSQEIITEIPVTRQAARQSHQAWIDRFSMVRNTLMMRGYIQDQRLGLAKLVYIGGTHRWPHKHLAWTARLGNPEIKPPFIQIMIVPPTAAERVMRFRSRLIQIDWSASQINYQLYDMKNDRWKTNISQIIKSIAGSKTIAHLEREFNVKRKGNIIVPTMDEAKVLDFASWGMYLTSLELGYYNDLLGMDRNTLRNTIMSFKEKGALQLQYFSYLSGLVSFCLEMKGELKGINSVARSALLHLPTATVMMSIKSKTCYIMGRVPEDSAYEILTSLPNKAKDYNLTIKGFRMTAYVGYINNLYQRLLKSDGTWDDDMSGFTSQIRS